MSKVLIVDDEADILDLLEYNLQKEGYVVLRAMDGEEALSVTKSEHPDLILLDIMMPKMDGIETCKRIRAMEGGHKPMIIFLTARSEEYSELAGFEAGADDYISKPVKPRILISRVQAAFRRSESGTAKQEPAGQKNFGGLKINREEYMVYKDGKAINLPRKEFELLNFLASHPGKVYSRDALLEKIWGEDVIVVERTVDVHIRKLREKIGQEFIQTIKGVGYKFTPPDGN